MSSFTTVIITLEGIDKIKPKKKRCQQNIQNNTSFTNVAQKWHKDCDGFSNVAKKWHEDCNGFSLLIGSLKCLILAFHLFIFIKFILTRQILYFNPQHASHCPPK